MTDFYKDEPVVCVTKEVGFNKAKLISSENRKKSRERMSNPNVVAGNYKLKELLSDVDIVVHPEKMTNWYDCID